MKLYKFKFTGGKLLQDGHSKTINFQVTINYQKFMTLETGALRDSGIRRCKQCKAIYTVTSRQKA